MTLSCVEYKWPDVRRLIKERMLMAGKNPDMFDVNVTKFVNEYSIVVQEYFQQRVKIWLKTVGKNVFKIKHHWLWYEFSPSRGQIHAHMLVISD